MRLPGGLIRSVRRRGRGTNGRHSEYIFLIICIQMYFLHESMMLMAAFSGSDAVTVCVGWRIVDFVGYGVCSTGKLDLKNVPLQSNHDYRPCATRSILPVRIMGYKGTLARDFVNIRYGNFS